MIKRNERHIVTGVSLAVALALWPVAGDGFPPMSIGREGSPSAEQRPATAAAPCDAGPTNPATSATSDLEEEAANWGVYCEGVPVVAKQNVSTPAVDGRALQISLTGGGAYSNAHVYRTLAAEPESRGFVLSLRFWFTDTTLNNESRPSTVQAIEFAMNKWHQGRRYEFALQWQNVGDRTAPQWRYWDPNRGSTDRWVSPGIADRLAPEQWHALTLEGEIVNGQVHYRRFNIDQRCHSLDKTIPPADALRDPDRLGVSVQLDGNAVQSPYSVFVDQVTFLRSSTDAPMPCGLLDGTAIDSMEQGGNWRTGQGGGAVAASFVATEGCQGRAVQLNYDLGSTPGAWAQVRRDFDPPLDLSRSDHIRFRYRGTTANMLEIGMISTDGRIFFATPWHNATHVPWCGYATWDLRDFRSNGQAFPDFSKVRAIFISVSNNAGGRGGTGSLVVDEVEGVNIASRTLPSCPERVQAPPAVVQRAAVWIGGQQRDSGLVKSWPEESADFAWLYDQALALLVLLETDAARAARLAAGLRELQNADGSWYAGYRLLTGAPINFEQPTGAQAWVTYAMARYAVATGDGAALASARRGADWLARLQRPNGSLPAVATAFGNPSAPTEANLDGWWAFTATGNQAEAARLRDFIVNQLWDQGTGRFKADADSYQIFLDNQTWGAAFLRALGRQTDASRALRYARWTLSVASPATRFGTMCGFDGAGPFGVWNEGVLQYVSQQGEDSQFYWDQVVAQQAADGGVPGSPLASELSAYIVWLTPWHGVAPTAWLYFAGTGGPPGWR